MLLWVAVEVWTGSLETIQPKRYRTHSILVPWPTQCLFVLQLRYGRAAWRRCNPSATERTASQYLGRDTTTSRRALSTTIASWQHRIWSTLSLMWLWSHSGCDTGTLGQLSYNLASSDWQSKPERCYQSGAVTKAIQGSDT